MIAFTLQFGAALALLVSCIDARAIHKQNARSPQQAYSTMDVGVFSGIFPPGYSVESLVGTAPPAPFSTMNIPAIYAPTAPVSSVDTAIATPSALVESAITTLTGLINATPLDVVVDTPVSVPTSSAPIPVVFSTGMPVFSTGMPAFPTGMPGPSNLIKPQIPDATVSTNTTSSAPPGVFISVPYMTVTVTVTASPTSSASQPPTIASPVTPAGIFGSGTGTSISIPTVAVQVDLPPPQSSTTKLIANGTDPSIPSAIIQPPVVQPMGTGAMPNMQTMASFATVDLPQAVPIATPISTGIPAVIPPTGTGTPPQVTSISAIWGNSSQPVASNGGPQKPTHTLTDSAMFTITTEVLSAVTTLTVV